MKISNVRLYAKNPMMICLMIVAIFSSSFSTLNALPTATYGNDFSKEELFKAVYFLDGELVNEIPALRKIKGHLSFEKTAEDIANQATIIKEVNRMDAGFMTRLYNNVKGGDHYSVSESLKDGGILFMLATSKTIKNKPSDFPRLSKYDLTRSSQREMAYEELTAYYQNGGGGVIMQDRQACIAVAIAVWYQIALWVLLWALVEVDTTSSVAKMVTSDKDISHEKLVNQLVTLN